MWLKIRSYHHHCNTVHAETEILQCSKVNPQIVMSLLCKVMINVSDLAALRCMLHTAPAANMTDMTEV